MAGSVVRGAVSDPETNLAEIGTYISEFGVLSQLTGERRYFDLAKRAMRHALDRHHRLRIEPFSVVGHVAMEVVVLRRRACAHRLGRIATDRPGGF